MGPKSCPVGWGGDRLCQTRLIHRSPDGDNNHNDCENGDDDNHVDDAKVTGSDEKIAARHCTCALLKPY